MGTFHTLIFRFLILASLGLVPALAFGDLKTIERPGYTLQLPANWSIATEDPDYDPDRFFTIDTPGRSNMKVEFFNLSGSQKPSDLLFSAIYVLDGPLVNTMSRSQFSQWGNLQGSGTHLKGKVMGMFPGGARIFFAVHNGRGLMITELYFSEDLTNTAPGFEVIANTFQWR